MAKAPKAAETPAETPAEVIAETPAAPASDEPFMSETTKLEMEMGAAALAKVQAEIARNEA